MTLKPGWSPIFCTCRKSAVQADQPESGSVGENSQEVCCLNRKRSLNQAPIQPVAGSRSVPARVRNDWRRTLQQRGGE